MADSKKADSVQEKIRQVLEKLGDALDDWLNRTRPAPRRVPVPVDRPYRRK